MAFMGSVQLEKFNATIYTSLVCLAMVREMGPLMVAIVMAGRTGASFAAELGSRKLSEELDSLRTLGIPVVDFLVLQKVDCIGYNDSAVNPLCRYRWNLERVLVGTQIMGFSSCITLNKHSLRCFLCDMGLWKASRLDLLLGSLVATGNLYRCQLILFRAGRYLCGCCFYF